MFVQGSSCNCCLCLPSLAKEVPLARLSLREGASPPADVCPCAGAQVDPSGLLRGVPACTTHHKLPAGAGSLLVALTHTGSGVSEWWCARVEKPAGAGFSPCCPRGAFSQAGAWGFIAPE